jgi:hypothetical protein
MYVTVYNELVKAYTILRNRESERRYNESYETCTCVTKNGQKRKRNPEYEKLERKWKKSVICIHWNFWSWTTTRINYVKV